MSSFNPEQLANPGVRQLRPYQAGKPITELERELGIKNIVKLASNENPLGISQKVKAALAEELNDLARYPDANGFYLKEKIAKKQGVEMNQITLGNGSNDVLELIARTFVNDSHEVIFSQHAFVVYPIVTQAIGATAVAVPAKQYGHDLDAMLAAISDKTRLIFIANPNNPTGTFLSAEALHDFLKQVPDNVLVVLDEAYTEFVPVAERSPSFAWVTEFPNLLVCRTFAKAYGLAGLRAGYTVSDARIADLLNRVRQPFNMNSLSLRAAEVALDDDEYLQQSVAINQAGMQQLVNFCEQRGLSYIPSYGNFLTIEVGDDAEQLYQELLQQGVIVRPVTGYQLPRHLRVSIGLPAENQAFIDAMVKLGR
ncbi:histidinol-phosphate transaminase [Idiomarina xiamenensis]|uniref:Histidinol-phosphate aminotransferase n=1 Tax=Idiomarina xiamenensis 10-D-4 TaxID=740709 RepID=K2JU09_9GAMM|nr:histidinol-phosphate transaminase [Idiomarina xiamenensis]EKE86931.1 histidinol-phosphate aminotransferase [Idiomarina xiamenensis 10-D-4]